MASTMRFDKWENTLGQAYNPVVQVVQTVDYNTTTIATGANTFNAYSGLDTTITPKLPGSKFLIRYQINVGLQSGSMRGVLKVNGAYYNSIGTGSMRASTNSEYVQSGLPATATIYALTGEYLFTNSSLNPVVVTFELYKQDSYAIYVNRAFTYDDTDRGRPTSWVTIQEIAQ